MDKNSFPAISELILFSHVICILPSAIWKWGKERGRNKEGPIFEKRKMEIKASAYGKTTTGNNNNKRAQSKPEITPPYGQGWRANYIFRGTLTPVSLLKKETRFFFFLLLR